MSLGLLSRASSGWRRVIEIGVVVEVLVRVVAVLVQVTAAFLASQNGLLLKAGLVRNRYFWALVRVRALGRSKTAHV